jgi:hypothetical protein
VAVAVRVAPVALFACAAGCVEVLTRSAALVVGFGAAGVVGVSVTGVSDVSDVASVAGVSALGGRTSSTCCERALPCAGRAVVCDRRAACA